MVNQLNKTTNQSMSIQYCIVQLHTVPWQYGILQRSESISLMDVLATLYSTYFLREGKNTTQRWNLIVIALKWNRQERVLPLHVVSLTNDYLCSFLNNTWSFTRVSSRHFTVNLLFILVDSLLVDGGLGSFYINFTLHLISCILKD